MDHRDEKVLAEMEKEYYKSRLIDKRSSFLEKHNRSGARIMHLMAEVIDQWVDARKREVYAITDWKPIETAPKDGTKVDLWVEWPGRSPAAGRDPDAEWTDRYGWSYRSLTGEGDFGIEHQGGSLLIGALALSRRQRLRSRGRQQWSRAGPSRRCPLQRVTRTAWLR